MTDIAKLAGVIAATLIAAACTGEAPEEPAASESAPAAPELAEPETPVGPAPSAADAIAAAVAATERGEDAVARDAGRKPAEMLEFAGVKPGDVVVEIAPGGGYYTALLSRVVGDEGAIIGVGPKRIIDQIPRIGEAFANYMAADPRANVRSVTAPLDSVQLPQGVDQVWMVLFYHDTVWTGVDRAAMNELFFDALAPGGVYFVVDHTGVAGGGEEITQSVHRIDPAMVREEIEAAGFVLDAQSDLLANPEDTLEEGVFSEGIRGKTDRFVYRYVKPE